MGYVVVGGFYVISTFQFPPPTKPVTSKSKAALVAYKECQSFVSKSKYQQARDSCSLAIKFDPEFPEAYNLRAMSHKFLGNYQQTLKDYQTTESLLLKQGHFPEAEKTRELRESEIYVHNLKQKNLSSQK